MTYVFESLTLSLGNVLITRILWDISGLWWTPLEENRIADAFLIPGAGQGKPANM
jgi:hypothetical protein